MNRALIGGGLVAVVIGLAAIVRALSPSSNPDQDGKLPDPALQVSQASRTKPQVGPPLALRKTSTATAGSEPASTAARQTNPINLGRDVEGAKRVLALIGKNLGGPEEKVAAVRAAIEQSGVCSAASCDHTRQELIRRTEAGVSLSGGRLELGSVRCFQVACMVDVATRGASIELILNHLRNEGNLDWPAVAIFTKPMVAEDGSESAIWAFFNPS